MGGDPDRPLLGGRDLRPVRIAQAFHHPGRLARLGFELPGQIFRSRCHRTLLGCHAWGSDDTPARRTSTRLSWKTAPPPMSASRSATVVLAFAPPRTRLGQNPLTPAATPAATRSLTITRARNSPRSLYTHASSPVERPRARASAGWSSMVGPP